MNNSSKSLQEKIIGNAKSIRSHIRHTNILGNNPYIKILEHIKV